MNTFPRISSVGALAAASVLFFNPIAKADIVANFTGGDGFESVDQYPGIPGDGWATAWQTNTASSSAGTSLVGFVDELAPMNGGGKYLSTFLTGGSGVSKGVQQRQYSTFDDVDILDAANGFLRSAAGLGYVDAHGEYGLLPGVRPPVHLRLRGERGVADPCERRVGEWHPGAELDVLQRRERMAGRSTPRTSSTRESRSSPGWCITS